MNSSSSYPQKALPVVFGDHECVMLPCGRATAGEANLRPLHRTRPGWFPDGLQTCHPAAAGLCLALLLAACGPPPEARSPASDRLRALPPPTLEPTAEFAAAAGASSPSAKDLLAEAETLRDRAAALRTRAEALSAPPAEEGLP
jgi:hypothetical protein